MSGEYSLLSDFGANWRIDNSDESIFEFANRMADQNQGTGTNVPHFFTTRNTTNYQGYGIHVPTGDLYSAFDPDDPRITYTFTMTGDRFLGDVENQNNFWPASGYSGYHDRKILIPYYRREGYFPWIIPVNTHIMRYADILLLYAEALNENGKAQEALLYLNQIRERARLTPPLDAEREKQVYVPPTDDNTLPDITTTDQTELRNVIWHERRVELAMEGWRRYDLMRQQRFGEVMRAFAGKYNTTKGKNFRDDRDYVLPIPQSEIDNSNGVITQNPNY